MNLRPLHDRVIVKRLDQETKTASGLIIPDAAAEKPDQGEILAVGNYSGQTVKVDGEELLVMREEDIMAVLVK
jgi:chaperonin GroES